MFIGNQFTYVFFYTFMNDFVISLLVSFPLFPFRPLICGAMNVALPLDSSRDVRQLG